MSRSSAMPHLGAFTGFRLADLRMHRACIGRACVSISTFGRTRFFFSCSTFHIKAPFSTYRSCPNRLSLFTFDKFFHFNGLIRIGVEKNPSKWATHSPSRYNHHTIYRCGMGDSLYCPALKCAFSIGAALTRIAPVGGGSIQQH